MLEACPSDFSFAAIRSADWRSARGPTRTRYRSAGPVPPVNTYAEKPCAFSWCTRPSELARLAKLPSCTAHPCAADMGDAAGVSTDAVGGGAGSGIVGVGIVGGGGVVVAAGARSVAAACSSEFAGALLVARSTVTFRVGSGAASGARPLGADPGLGPDNNSGTTSTTNATKIDAPIRRSFTRRSIFSDSPLPLICAKRRSIFGKPGRRQQPRGLEPIQGGPDGMK